MTSDLLDVPDYQPSGTERQRQVRIMFEPSEREESQARFGRSRFLKMVGATVFGTAAGLAVKASPAYAAACSVAAPGAGCHSWPQCNCCNQAGCCVTLCQAYPGYCTPTNDGYPDGPGYWSACVNTYLYRCYDYCQTCTGGYGANCGPGKKTCICRIYVGRC